MWQPSSPVQAQCPRRRRLRRVSSGDGAGHRVQFCDLGAPRARRSAAGAGAGDTSATGALRLLLLDDLLAGTYEGSFSTLGALGLGLQLAALSGRARIAP